MWQKEWTETLETHRLSSQWFGASDRERVKIYRENHLKVILAAKGMGLDNQAGMQVLSQGEEFRPKAQVGNSGPKQIISENYESNSIC